MTDEAPTLAELTARVARIEQRLSTEAGRAAGPADGPSTGAGPDEVFWVLHELERRLPAPAVLFAGRVETADGPVHWQEGYDSAALLEEDWTSHAATLAALGHPSRLKILQLVVSGAARTAAELAHNDGLGTTGQIYHHLRQLVSAGWLRSTTRGQHVIPPERVVPLLTILAASH